MDNLSTFIELGKLATTIIAIVAAVWAFQKWRSQDELFPRVFFEVTINFIGKKEKDIICELVAILENKGVVPLKLRNMTFVVRGLLQSDQLAAGGEEIRRQINFKRVLAEGEFIPKGWNYTFIYPGVRTEYNFVTSIPAETVFVRMQADFEYDKSSRTHHAAKVLAIPRFESS
jgi:hypothetical protein